MIIYQDLISGKEMFSDTLKHCYEDDDFIVAVDGKCKKYKVGGEQVDIGANPSQEGEDEDCGVDDASEVTEVDVVHDYKLEKQEDFFATKSAVSKYMKQYIRLLAKKLEDNGEAEKCGKFKTNCSKKLKAFIDKFNPDECTIYTAEGFDPEVPDHNLFIAVWNPDGMSMKLYTLADGLFAEKV